MQISSKAFLGIRVIAVANGVAAFLHVLFWSFALYRLVSMPSATQNAERIDRIVTAGVGVADLLWSVPFLLAGCLGLLRRLPVGWLGAQMANALWWYSYTFLLIREFAMGVFRPGTMIFLPFALFSFWSAWYLWHNRDAFWNESGNAKGCREIQH